MVICHGTLRKKSTQKQIQDIDTVDGRNPKQPPGMVQTL